MRTPFYCILFSIVGIALLIASGCNPAAVSAPTAAAANRESTRVAVVKPERKTLKYTIEEPGQIEGFEEAPLYAKLAAYVDVVNVDIGSPVEPNAVLATLKIPELHREFEQKVAAVNQAKAALEQAQAATGVANAAVKSAKAKLAAVKATVERAEADYRRWSSENGRIAELADKGSVTRKMADETKDQLAAADAARKEAAAQVESAAAGVTESEARATAALADEAGARAKIAATEADQAHTKALLSYTEIRAPFAGVVTRRNVHPGHFVQPAEGSGGKPLFVVARTDLLRVIADIPESEAPFVTVGNRADIRVPAMANKLFSETVKRTSVALDGATRTLRVEMDLKNDDRTWRPGLYVYVVLSVARPNVLTVPAEAVFSESGQAYCSAIVGGKIERRPIEVGVRTGGDVQVISGVQEADRLVAKDPANYRAGQAVAEEGSKAKGAS